MPPATDDVVTALSALRAEVEACTLCDLHATRTRGVPGDGDPGADLMFVGEAPGYHEDQQGRPFVGQAGKLLDQLLAGIGLAREQVFIANVLKCRPPNNRDPRPEEIAACRPHLWRQIALIRPRVICTLGNFATKLLRDDQTGITRVHGQPTVAEIGGHRLYLYPIFHPAAALYTPAMRTTLEEDFARLPGLLAQAAPQQGEETAASPPAERPAWRPPERLRRPDSEPESPAGHATAGPAWSDPAADDSAPDDSPAGGPATAGLAAGGRAAPGDPAPAEPEQLGLF